MVKSRSELKSVAIELALPTGQKVLLVDIQIDCPACGIQTYRIKT